MSFWEIVLVGIGLSMDALAVALCKGLSMKQFHIRDGVIIAGFFGGFQALMPLIGWFLGTTFAKYIESVDHWVAFALLLLIGGKMILDAVRDMRKPKEQTEQIYVLRYGELTLLAIATSIDALAVGITFACLRVGESAGAAAGMNIWISVLLIGIITFVLSFAGVLIGNRFGSRFEAKAQIAGGVILILLGVKILLEHLGILQL